jgi:uncharacterized membrane protein YeaQ/YmgE (transglycosylase-associated protein family)
MAKATLVVVVVVALTYPLSDAIRDVLQDIANPPTPPGSYQAATYNFVRWPSYVASIVHVLSTLAAGCVAEWHPRLRVLYPGMRRYVLVGISAVLALVAFEMHVVSAVVWGLLLGTYAAALLPFNATTGVRLKVALTLVGVFCAGLLVAASVSRHALPGLAVAGFAVQPALVVWLRVFRWRAT